MRLGAHVSVTGGLENGPPNGVALGCDVIQIFTRNQRQWAAKPITSQEAEAFQTALKASGLKDVMSHGSYLANMASPDEAMWAKSVESFTKEAQRCDALGVSRLVFHPGAHMESGVEAGRKRIAKGLRKALAATKGSPVKFCLETMAGQGTTVGHVIEDLGAIIEEAGGDDRLGICIDTCHVFAAGYDLTTPKSYEAFMQNVDEAVGLERVQAFHLNDSLMGLGEKRDRHANVGEGRIGVAGFKPLMKDARFAKIPMALETPGGDEGYKADLKALRALVK
jgi:deoxyribonuclease IV